MQVLHVILFSVLAWRGDAEVDYGQCIAPCMSTMVTDFGQITSDTDACTVSTTGVNCLTSACELKERNIPTMFFEFLHNLYRTTGFTCEKYATIPFFLPRGAETLIDTLRDVFGTLFRNCDGFEDCLAKDMSNTWGTGDDQQCITNHAMKKCIEGQCPARTQEAGASLLQLFFRKMEERGHGCDQEGLHSSSYTPGYVRPILPGSSAMVNLPASMAGNYTVDIDECGSACQSVMLMKLITSTSGSMCSASNSFASCVRVMCDTGFKLPPSAYEYLQSVYRSHQDSCDTYATTPPHTPISGVDRVVLAIGKFAQELFSRCTGFEACVRQELALGMDFNETTACNTDRTLQTCVNSKCPTSQANKGYLLNVFYYRMEQKGYLCEKSGFQYSPDVTTTSTTTATTTTTTTTTTTRAPTTTQVVHPSCSDGINFCDEYSGPAVIECSMQDRYIQCITGKCNLQGRRVPIFLLRKLEWEQRQMGLDCDLVGSEPASGAPEPRAFSRSLTAMLLTLSVVLLNL